ncbi:MAG TPA: SH3 domain-containing protein [Candidatus Ozemobacteraceae bacterium]|nr:SH3 domain-containing protein [Candidatus Ozemobacteraceae bacterium]
MNCFGRTGRNPCLALLALFMTGLTAVCSAGIETRTKNLAVNLRKEPSLKSEVLMKLPPASKVTILEECIYWYRVKYDDKTEGYVYYDLLERCLPIVRRAPKKKARVAAASRSRPRQEKDIARQQATFAFADRRWQEVVRILAEDTPAAKLTTTEGYMLGIAWRELGRTDKAEEALMRALGHPERAWDATSAEIYRQLLEIQRTQGRWADLLVTVRRAEKHASSVSWVAHARAEAYLHLKRPTEALSEFEAIAGHDPQDVKALVGMGRAKAKLDDLTGAEKDFRAAIARPATCEEAYLCLAGLQARRGYTKAAELTLQDGLRRLPGSTVLATRVGEIQARQKVADEHAELLKKQDRLLKLIQDEGIAIRAFTVVAQLKPKLYEIRLGGTEAAFLQTSRSFFAGRGDHEMPLKDGGTIPVRLSPKNGGFLQQARLLKELTDAQTVTYHAMTLELSDVNQALELLDREQKRLEAAVEPLLE